MQNLTAVHYVRMGNRTYSPGEVIDQMMSRQTVERLVRKGAIFDWDEVTGKEEEQGREPVAADAQEDAQEDAHEDAHEAAWGAAERAEEMDKEVMATREEAEKAAQDLMGDLVTKSERRKRK